MDVIGLVRLAVASYSARQSRALYQPPRCVTARRSRLEEDLIQSKGHREALLPVERGEKQTFHPFSIRPRI
jgi:hypothetical protein